MIVPLYHRYPWGLQPDGHDRGRRSSHGLAYRVMIVMALSLLATSSGFSAEPVDFAREIRPLLADHCLHCHGPDPQTRQADLRLDQPDGLESVIAREALASSELLRRLQATEADVVMPPPDSKKPLSPEARVKLEQWILAGAPWTTHWAFTPRTTTATLGTRTADAASHAASWPRNRVDDFVLQRLTAHGLQPSPAAPRTTLIRRLYLDLLGLLPSPAEVERFVRDARPDAYERLVDELLSNPHFGERWGRHWLDQARYADSDGYSIDGKRVMWPYRDWVIEAINVDLPFDQFTIDQLAGDLLPAPTPDQRVATGFHRNTLINQEGGTDPEQFRNEAVIDRVNTTGAVWLGLTVGCAQCHSHKFDPISQREYYQLFAFFNSDEDTNTHAPEYVVAPPQAQGELQQLTERLAAARQTLEQQQRQAPPDAARLKQTEETIKQTTAEIAALEQRYGKTLVMRARDQRRETHVLTRGDFLRPGEAVEPGVPAALGTLPPHASGTRVDLAHWIVDPNHPLTARVTVNRLWLQYFGRGLVETENDFGTQGTPPSHPELLDWLASELIRQDWSLKAIHRTILLSATYRQSSAMREQHRQLDPDNHWLARQARLRITAEIVRDLALCCGDTLCLRIGGPSVYPSQPDGVYAFTQENKAWVVSTGEDRWRRGMYTFFYRSAPHPFLTTFDAPNFQTSCTQRLRSNTPLQALTVANDEVLIVAAERLATRLLAGPQLAEPERLALAFRICLSRSPSAPELARLQAYLAEQRAEFAQQLDAAAKLTGQTGPESVELAAWLAVGRVLINSDEFITRN